MLVFVRLRGLRRYLKTTTAFLAFGSRSRYLAWPSKPQKFSVYTSATCKDTRIRSSQNLRWTSRLNHIVRACAPLSSAQPAGSASCRAYSSSATAQHPYDKGTFDAWKNAALERAPQVTYDQVTASTVQRLFQTVRKEGTYIQLSQELSQSEKVLVNTSAKALSDTRTSAHQVFPSSNWLAHLYDVPSYGLAFDGYAPDNSPPPPFGPRMWAGGRVQWLSEPKFGDFTRQETSVESIKVKDGRQGPLVFVRVLMKTVDENTSQDLIIEHRDFVYKWLDPNTAKMPAQGRRKRADDASGDKLRSQEQGVNSQSWTMSPVQLLRYSAVTFNAHRIHWDHEYCTKREGFPNLVVHGPLSTTLLLKHLRELVPPSKRILELSHRAVGPLFADEAFTTNVKSTSPDASQFDLFIETSGGDITMIGEARVGPA